MCLILSLSNRFLVVSVYSICLVTEVLLSLLERIIFIHAKKNVHLILTWAMHVVVVKGSPAQVLVLKLKSPTMKFLQRAQEVVSSVL